MSARLIQIYPANLASFEESRIFVAPAGRVWGPPVLKRDMKFYAHNF